MPGFRAAKRLSGSRHRRRTGPLPSGSPASPTPFGLSEVEADALRVPFDCAQGERNGERRKNAP
ncbi:MAG: hypothetical protein K2X59_00430 [Sphingomonas sp.]|nr:hypothetical protein [Sphingomonas sp.]